MRVGGGGGVVPDSASWSDSLVCAVTGNVMDSLGDADFRFLPDLVVAVVDCADLRREARLRRVATKGLYSAK